MHKDPNTPNFIINKDENFNISLIDVDNIYKWPILPLKLQAKSLSDFIYLTLYSLKEEHRNLFNIKDFLEYSLINHKSKYQKKIIEYINVELINVIDENNTYFLRKHNYYINELFEF